MWAWNGIKTIETNKHRSVSSHSYFPFRTVEVAVGWLKNCAEKLTTGTKCQRTIKLNPNVWIDPLLECRTHNVCISTISTLESQRSCSIVRTAHGLELFHCFKVISFWNGFTFCLLVLKLCSVSLRWALCSLSLSVCVCLFFLPLCVHCCFFA